MRKLFTSENRKARINPEFVHFNNETNFSPERHIEVMYNEIKRFLFEEAIKLGLIDKDDAEDELQMFNSGYGLVKTKFQHIERNTGGRYFDHQIRVAYKILKESTNPTFRKVLMSIDHDTLEDTDITFEALQQIFSNDDIPFGVLLISKEPFLNFLDNDEDRETFRQIEETGILNSKGLPKDRFLQTKKKHPEKISSEENEAYERYKILEKKYKNIRNQSFFSHMIDFDTFYNHALKLAKEHKLRFTEEEIKEICLDALEVKYFDRIDNLQTSEIYRDFTEENLQKAIRKIKETKNYFYHIASQTHRDLFELIKAEVERLEEYILEKELEMGQKRGEVCEVVSEVQDRVALI